MQTQQPSSNQILFDTFTRLYQGFVELLNKLPIDATLKYQLTHQTSGVYLWVKEAMIEAERVEQAKVQAAAAVQPKLEVVDNSATQDDCVNQEVKDKTCVS